MKKLCFIFAMLFFSLNGIIAQTQKLLWSLPPQQLSFPPTTFSGLPSPFSTPAYPLSDYNGLPAVQAHNSWHDANGNLMFFIVDGVVYDKVGLRIGSIALPGSEVYDLSPPYNVISWTTVKGWSEWIIVPVPKSCSQFYLIGVTPNIAVLQGLGAFSIVLDLSLANTNSAIGFDGNPNAKGDFVGHTNLATEIITEGTGAQHCSKSMHLGVTQLNPVTGNRLLFISTCSEIFVGTITAAGISEPAFKYQISDASNSADDVRNELEIIQIPAGNSYQFRLTVGYKGNAGSNPYRVFIGDFDLSGNFVPGSERILNPAWKNQGLEFDPAGDNLFIASDINSAICLQWYKYSTNTLNTVSAVGITNTDYKNSQIELTRNGTLAYFSGSKIAIINNPGSPTGAFTASTVTVSPSIGPSSGLYTLNDQIDGEDYVQTIQTMIASEPSCCGFYLTLQTDGIGMALTYTANEATETWTPTSNPFGGTVSNPVPVVHIFEWIRFPAKSNITIRNMTFKFQPRTFGPTFKGGYAIAERGDMITATNGAKLTLDNTNFTDDNICAVGMWEGIWVNGYDNYFLNNNRQARLIIKNNSVISNAYVGVITGKFVDENPIAGMMVAGTGGGKVTATQSSFINNKVAVRFKKYFLQNSTSVFTDCIFETNNQLNVLTEMPFAFAHLEYINGVSFSGCDFRNTDLIHYTIGNTGNTGMGIYGFDAGCNVNAISYTWPPEFSDPSRFTNLQYGLNMYNQSAKYTLVDHSLFVNNYRGILLRNFYSSSVTSNNFQVFQQLGGWSPNWTAYGLYLFYCRGFSVQENFFTYSTTMSGFPPPPGANSFGIIVSMENPARLVDQYDEIYKNSFDRIYTGIQTQGNNSEQTYYEVGFTGSGNYWNDQHNANQPNNNGLKLLCNNLSNIQRYDFRVADFSSVKGNIAYQQGICPKPAGNQFSHSYCPILNTLENDYAIHATALITTNPVTSNTTSINYAHNTDNGFTIPYCYTPPVLAPPVDKGAYYTPCLIPYGTAPDALYPTCPSKLPSYNVVHTYFHPLMQQSWREVIGYYQNEANNISAQIQNETDPERLIELHASLSYNIGQRNNAVNELIQAFYCDTLIDPLDSIIPFLIEGWLPDWKNELAFAYLSKGDFENAETVKNEIAQAAGTENFVKIFNVLLALAQSDEGEQLLLTETTLESLVREVAQELFSREAQIAIQLLNVVFAEPNPEWIEPELNGPEYRIGSRQEKNPSFVSLTRQNYFTLYPNPSNDNVKAEYWWNGNQQAAVLKMYDVTGRNVKNISLISGENKTDFTTSGMEAGVYFCSLEIEGNSLAQIKFVILNK